MELDPLLLSRAQFALTIMFHYLFPPLSIGLGAILVILEGLYLRSGNLEYHALARFWTRIFAVNFAVGVASGIVMEFQFGTNWSRYSRFVGDVFGSALAAEGIFAFFLESGFLAVLVFGWDRVSKRMHFFATCMVCLGSMFSAVWIVIANSWMHTPAGYHIVQTEAGPRAQVVDFWAVVLNPSSVQRLIHVLLGSWIQGSFFVLSISAWYLLKKRHESLARRSFNVGLCLAIVAIIAIWISGDSQARKVASTQPAKLAAFEGNYRTREGPTPMAIFGIPDSKEQRLSYEVSVPGLLSFLVHGDFKTPVTALDAFPPEDRPPVPIPYFMYHLMIGAASALLLLILMAAWHAWRGTIHQTRWLLWCFVFAVAAAYAANQAGWIAAEVGRQPWVVYGVLRTKDAWSPSVPASHILTSIILFSVVYLLLFAVWIVVLHGKIQHGPDPDDLLPREGADQDLLEAASRRGKATSYSMTEAKP